MSLVFTFRQIAAGAFSVTNQLFNDGEIIFTAYGIGSYDGIGNKAGVSYVGGQKTLYVYVDGVEKIQVPYKQVGRIERVEAGQNVEVYDTQITSVMPSIPDNPYDDASYMTSPNESYQINLGYISVFGVPDIRKIQDTANMILQPIGYYCNSVNATSSVMTLNIIKVGSPALPIVALIAALTIALVGIVIISVQVKSILATQAEAAALEEKVSNLKTMDDVIDGLRDDYTQGAIDKSTYESFVSQLLQMNESVVSADVTPDNTSTSGIDMMGMIGSIMPVFLVIALLNAVKK